MIEGLQRSFPNYMIGYSDHTVPDENMLILATAYLKGARVIEKHFTHDKTLPGNDHYHAMDMLDLQNFKRSLAFLIKVCGSQHKMPLPSEAPARENARRSIVLSESVSKGTVLTAEMLTCKRPGSGISPIFWDMVIGRRILCDLKPDDILHFFQLEI
jgi:N-acetylneuraminate synthase